MTDNLSRQLITLRADFRARSLKAPGDGALQDRLSEQYLEDAMVLLDAAYRDESAARVRAGAPWPPGRAHSTWPARLGRAVTRHVRDWYAVWLAAGHAR